MNCDRITSEQCIIIDSDDYIISESEHGSSSKSSLGWNILDRLTKDSSND
jgi:hypothetical protein